MPDQIASKEALGFDKGFKMATAAITLEQWNAEYYKAMAATARVRLAVQSGMHRVRLGFKFWDVKKDFETLVHLLSLLETQPSTVLLHEQAREIPKLLRMLFRKTCDVLEAAARAGIARNWPIREEVSRLNQLNQEVAGFADRFEMAQQKLRTLVPHDQVPFYNESVRAYNECELSSDVATDEDLKHRDVALHF
jgi:hypothetical protein